MSVMPNTVIMSPAMTHTASKSAAANNEVHRPNATIP
jgi:hypothetical protein